MKNKLMILGFLAFAILFLSTSQAAKAERKGAELLVTKVDGQVVQGELIALRGNSLLLLDSASSADVSVDIQDAKTIKVIKKSYIGAGLGLGFLLGAGTGALLGSSDKRSGWLVSSSFATWMGAGIGGAVGAIIGLLTAAEAGSDKTITLNEEADSSTQKKTLEKLSSMARIKSAQ